METSGQLFKNKLDKAFQASNIKLNQTTMGDAMKYKQSFKEEKIEGGVADGKTLMDVVKKHSKGDSVDPSTKKKIKDIFRKIKIQLNKGIKVEMEHTKSRIKAKEIAMDHLWEDPKYYDKLKKIESNEGKEKKYLDIEDMIPELRKQLNKNTMFDKDKKKEDSSSKKETKEETEVSEKWSEKYKKSIDCSNPKGFSQKAHCQGRKKKETKEATGSGSAGAYSGPVFGGNDEFWEKSKSENPKLEEQVEKVEATEATGSGSVGGYETPAMWAKSTKKKDWGPSRKTQIPGGGFVKVKKKCTKFPYCNQGDINNLKISKNESVKNAIKSVSNKLGISESTIITILEHEYEKSSKRTK
jgi:hypothetical protein